MDYDVNYIVTKYKPEELNEIFVREFARVRRENNLTQTLLAKYSNVNREKITRIEKGMHSPSVLSLLQILGPIGYTLKIVKVKEND